MELRKVQEVGKGTSFVSLPKDWVRRHGIGKGSVVEMEVDEDGNLLVRPLGAGRKAKELTLEYPSKESLTNELAGAYLLGYDVIRISGRIDHEGRELIKGIVRKLVGLEIVEEDSSTIVAQFLIEPTTLSPRKLLMRMHRITSSMHGDAIESALSGDRNLAKLVKGRDEEVNRLYFLLVRLVRSAVISPSLARAFSMSALECMDFRVAANLIEGIGDASSDMADCVILLRTGLKDFEEELKEIKGLLQRSQETAVRMFMEKKGCAREFSRIRELIQPRLQTLREKALELDRQASFTVLSMVDAMQDIFKAHMDIADLCTPLYPMVK